MVMDAANKLDIYIPFFCYHKKLTIAANCRMCLVDVEKAPKPLPACATPVAAGMVVHTHSEKAITAQKGVMEFLLINHPLDCPICDQGGECQLQDLAVGYGSSASRYKEEKRVVFHKDAGPLVAMDEMTRCIHCTRCVRFGQEIAGVMELGMLNRGELAEITTFVGKAIDSELSGNMIDICPVGALTSKPFRYTARNWELSRRKSVSPHDSLGANLIVQVKNDEVMRVLPLENEAINECWLSDKDRFSYLGLNSPERLSAPMIKTDGQWREVEWQEALEHVVRGLKSVRGAHGAQAIGALGSPHSTLEELYLLQKLMRALGSNNIDTRLRQSDFSLDTQMVGIPWLGMSIAEFAALDRALVVGSFLRKDHPLLAQRLRQAQKRGAKIHVLHGTDEELLIPLAGKIIVPPSAWPAALAEIAAAIALEKGIVAPLEIEAPESARVAAHDLLSGTHKAVLIGNAAMQHPKAAQIIALGQWIAKECGGRLGILTEAANSVGAFIAGATPGPGGLNATAQLADPRRAYVLLNVEPELDCADPFMARRAMDEADMVVALTSFKGTVADYADVLLPIAPFTETSGTFVSAEGRAQSFYGTVKPRGQARPAWKVLRVLGNLLDLDGFDYEDSETIYAEAMAGQPEILPRLNNTIGVVIEKAHISVESVDAKGVLSLERLSDVPIYFSDPLVRRSGALQQTSDARAPRVHVDRVSAAHLSLAEGDSVRALQGNASAILTVTIDDALASGTVRISAAHSTTATLGPMFGPITIEKWAGRA